MLRILIVLTAALAAYPSAATEAGWALLRSGGQTVLMRNANAPGVGDPANFDVEECSTQRNLSERGRNQARRTGALIAARAAPIGKVVSSRYCRAIETARLVFEDNEIEPFAALDSIDADPEDADERIEDTLSAIRDYSGTGNFFLVTHLSNIKALAGVSPREGEAVIVAPTDDGLAVSARIVFN